MDKKTMLRIGSMACMVLAWCLTQLGDRIEEKHFDIELDEKVNKIIDERDGK